MSKTEKFNPIIISLRPVANERYIVKKIEEKIETNQLLKFMRQA